MEIEANEALGQAPFAMGGKIEEAKKRTGLGAGDVALKYDFRGNPIKGFGSDTFRLVQNVFNPFNYSESSNDVVAEEILRLGYNMPKLRENLNGDINLNDSTSSNSPVITYGTMCYDSHGMRIADYNANNNYSLDLITYQSGIDPNFVVYSFKQPNLSSTQLRDNSFMTWFVHDYTSPGLFDYNDLFLGGVTLIAGASDGTTDLDQPYIRFRSYFGGQHRDLQNDDFSKRSAECGFLPFKQTSINGYPEGTPYFDTIYGTTSLETKSGNNDHVNLYYRSNLSHIKRSTGGDTEFKNNNQYYTVKRLPDTTNFNAVIKGLPLQVKIAPVPYYLPNDFAMIDFDVSTPQANIQQGDTITVSNNEVYTIITGSYNQTSRTRGILFCARTT